MFRKEFRRFLCVGLTMVTMLTPIKANALADMEAFKLLPIQSNSIENWPSGPALGCYSALLMDADTGVVLYEKNAHEQMYPASTTKLLTCVLAMEKEDADLNDLVDFSWDAVMTVPPDSSNMGMDAGEKMTLEECLYGILVLSANEVSNAVAEYVSGNISDFVYLMNERAKELGCKDTHFENPHGYTDPNHYTTAYDLALIAREFFKNELLSKISRTPTYHWYPTEYQPDDIYLGSTNYFMKGRKSCEGIVGSKTGYTDESRNVLVTCAERNGMKLIAVVMKEETPYQYDDTNTLLDYGFSNFEKIKVYDYETKYIVTDETFFHSDEAVFGDCSSVLKMDQSSSIILPKTISFSDLNSAISLSDEADTTKGKQVATVTYSYGGMTLGTAYIYFNEPENSTFVFDEVESEINEESEKKEPTFIYINYVIYVMVGIFVFFIIMTVIRKVLSNFHFSKRRKAKRRRKRRYVPGPSARSFKKERPDKVRRKRHKHRRRSSYLDM